MKTSGESNQVYVNSEFAGGRTNTAKYPLIMKQQTIDDKVIKDSFGMSGQELQEIRTAITGLQKGELIIKDQMAFALGMGNKYKKINVSHLI